MILEKRTAALEAQVEGIWQRLVALERRVDDQTSTEELRRDDMREMKEGMETLDEQTPANSATREVMWRRIEALEGAPSDESLPPLMAQLLRRLAALEERLR